MMGEYVLYWRDRVVGGLYDERLLLKDVTAVREAAPESSDPHRPSNNPPGVE